MKRAIERLFGVEARVVEAADTGPEVLIDNPREAGADRLVNAVGALAYPSPTGRYIVVDFGTATTFDLVEAPNRYLGGAIAIGPQTAADALAQRTAKLPRIDLTPPKAAVGKNTTRALRSGLVLGYAALVEGMVRRFKEEAGEALVIATGGSPRPLGPSAPALTWWTRTSPSRGFSASTWGEGEPVNPPPLLLQEGVPPPLHPVAPQVAPDPGPLPEEDP